MLERIPQVLPRRVYKFALKLGRRLPFFRLTQQTNLANFILDNMLDAIVTTDRFGTIRYANSVLHILLGYEQRALIGQNVRVIMPSHYRVQHPQYMADYNRTKQVHVIGHTRRLEVQDKSGRLIPVELRVSECKGVDDFHFLGVLRDLRQLIEKDRKIEQIVYRDLLTGLLNRNGLTQALSAILDPGLISERGRYTLLSLDIDDFHLINGGFSSDVADCVLVTTAKRLKQINNLAVARVTKDEFAILLPGALSDTLNAARYEQLKSMLEQPIFVAENKISIRVTGGACCFSTDTLSGVEIVRRSQAALGLAKREDRNGLCFYDPDRADSQRTSAGIDQRLKSSDYLDELYLVFQPQFHSTQGLIGYEALIRWQVGSEFIPPDHFIPIAEHNGTIIEIGDWLIEQACEFLRRYPKAKRLSINISPRQFQQSDFADQVIEKLREHGIEPSRLHLELTERLLIESVGDVVEKMNTLSLAGITFSLDDFGTGYSSLAYLGKLPLAELKIDKSFIHGLVLNSGNYRIVEAIISLAKSLGLNVIAEGVETEQEHLLLQTIGCHTYQGYLFARPVRMTEIMRIEQRRLVLIC